MFQRLTTVGQALLNATANEIKAGKVDHQRGTGHWVARHVAEHADRGSKLGIITEYDKRPQVKKKETTPFQAKLEDGEDTID